MYVNEGMLWRVQHRRIILHELEWANWDTDKDAGANNANLLYWRILQTETDGDALIVTATDLKY